MIARLLAELERHKREILDLVRAEVRAEARAYSDDDQEEPPRC